jgi:hypothetical protein
MLPELWQWLWMVCSNGRFFRRDVLHIDKALHFFVVTSTWSLGDSELVVGIKSAFTPLARRIDLSSLEAVMT